MAKRVKDPTNARYNVALTQSEEEKALVQHIKDCYRSSYLYKDAIGMNDEWSTAEDYWAGDVNLPEDANDPGSETNIIQSIIESQVADLVDGSMDMLVKGTGPSDEDFADDVRTVLKWIWDRNNMIVKLDEAERDRLNLGTVGWKVYFDPDALNGRGMPVIEPRSPDCLFPDPKIKDPRRIQEGDFFIDVSPYPLKQLVRLFGERAKLVKPEGNFTNYDPRIFGEGDYDAVDEIINDQALLFEFWEKDEEGNLRRVYMAGDVILDDSDWTHKKSKDGARKSFYRKGKYPFVIIPCYRKKGKIWGLSDNKLLRPVQDVINDLDDQIRMNARLMGNLQIVVGMSAGINLKKWTNEPGLKIPAKDHNAWQRVEPGQMPSFVLARRETGFRESEIVSGRADVLEGRKPGSLRAASAIIALQEAGSRRANHKKLMLQEGFKEILEMTLDYVKEFMDEEYVFDITERGNTTYTWFRGSTLNEIPWKVPNENFNPISGEPGTDQFRVLYEPERDEDGNELYDETIGDSGEITRIPRMKPVTKEAEFDLSISFGAGLPNNKSFIYQAVIELVMNGLITREEGRATLKNIMDWPIPDAFNPVGEFVGKNLTNGALGALSPEQPGLGGQPQPQAPNEEQLLGQLMQTVDQLPPEILQQIFSQGGGEVV